MDEQWQDEQENEQELAMMEAEYHYWKQSQDERDLPAHKRSGYAESMMERADELRQLSKEMMQ